MNAICIFDTNSSFNSGKLAGFVSFHQYDQNKLTRIVIDLSGFKPNKIHAIHIHEEGDLSKGCESLCAHYNPFGKLHGNVSIHRKNRHVGDLINNIQSDNNGNVKLSFTDDLVSLYEPYSVIGRSIVIHEKEDDLGIYRNDNTPQGKESGKTGNAGKRISCCIIGRSKTDFHNC